MSEMMIPGRPPVKGLEVTSTGQQGNSFTYHVDGSSALTDAVVKAAPGPGQSIYVTDIEIHKDAATAINVFFESAGSTKVYGPIYLEAIAGRGFAKSFKTPLKIAANTSLTVTSSAAIAHAIDVQGFTA